MSLVYLAGPITGLSYGGAVDWRESVRTDLARVGIRGLSPMRGKEYLRGEFGIADEYASSVLSCSRGITTRDRFDCNRADLLIVNLLGATKVSIGTVMEIAWADSKRIPVILVIEDEGNIHDHAMIRECTGFRVNTLEEAVKIAKVVLTDGL